MQMIEKDSGPKWGFLLQRDKVALWEAIAALVNIDPGKLKRVGEEVLNIQGVPTFRPDRFVSADQVAAFDSALGLAEKATGKEGPIHCDSGGSYYPGHKFVAKVSLREVVKYFRDAGWPDIPAPLLVLVPPGTGKAQSVDTAADVLTGLAVTAAHAGAKTHLSKRRAEPLHAVIKLAQSKAADASDWQSVWAALVKIALSKEPPAPLLGYVDGEGVKYQLDDSARPVRWLTRDAIRQRFKRARAEH
jgi:hypothetical protein